MLKQPWALTILIKVKLKFENKEKSPVIYIIYLLKTGFSQMLNTQIGVLDFPNFLIRNNFNDFPSYL